MPDLPKGKIISSLAETFSIAVADLERLPIGADSNVTIYRVFATNGRSYFLKLKKGAFDKTAALLTSYLAERGIEQIIPPILTKSGLPWVLSDDSIVMLYPFVGGQNAYDVPLLNRHWQAMGAALKKLHTISVPHGLLINIKEESFSSEWRIMAMTYLGSAGESGKGDRISKELVSFLSANSKLIKHLITRAESLAETLRDKSPEMTLCHADLHAGNILVSNDGKLHIIDWDEITMAPKERDLMAIGGGWMGRWLSPREEETLFYSSYGRKEVDQPTLAYYRYERIVQDIALFSNQILLEQDSPEDREQAYQHLISSFKPNGIIEIALDSDPGNP